MRAKGENRKRLKGFLALPMRVLGRAKDFYVRSMAGSAELMSHGGVMGPVPFSLTKSFSVRSSSTTSRSSNRVDDQYRRDLELAIAASARSCSSGSGNNNMISRAEMMRRSSTVGTGQWSSGVGMGRIEEEAAGACDDEEHDTDSDARSAELLYPRSKSCSATNKSVFF